MTSRISVREQLQLPFSKPQEILTYSQRPGQPITFDQSGLSYFYLPRADVERRPVDLGAGFDPKTFDPDAKVSVYLDTLLEALVEYERRHQRRADADIITWRGCWTQIIALSQPQVDRYAVDNGLDMLVVGYDGQIFLTHSPDNKNKPRPAPQTAQEKLSQLRALKFNYSGYKFEQVAMLDKPWGECSRDDIESRYTDKHFRADDAEYDMLIRSKIGNITLLYAAETDGVEGFKPTSGDLHRNYVELKTTNLIQNRHQAEQFERKLYKTWIQSYLSRVPKVVYGFRDPETLRLMSTEEFATDSIPKLISNSPITAKPQRWSAKRCLGFFGVMAKFLKDRVEDGKTYRLSLDRQTMELTLEPTVIDVGRKVAFLTDEFVNWRSAQHQSK